jgi:predicted PurR-regulated permease PerM
VLAIGLVVAVNCVTFAVLYDAIISSASGLSENATQVLTTAFGGIIGVLGAFIGFKAGRSSAAHEEQEARMQPPSVEE